MYRHVKALHPVLILVATIVLLAGIGQAAPILGTLKLGGAAEVTLTAIDFKPLGGPSGQLTSLDGDGVFSTLAPPPFWVGVIVDRTNPPQAAGVPINVPNWITFTSAPLFRYALDLTFINVGTYPSGDCFAAPADGQTCTPPAPNPFQSPYNLSNFVDAVSGLSSNATFSVRGVMRNLDTGTIDFDFNGVFGAEFLGLPYQSVLALVSGGGSVAASYSATIQATALIPEPGTGLLVAVGGALVALGAFRRRRSLTS